MTARAHVLVVIVTVLVIGMILGLIRRRQLNAKYSMLWLSVGFGMIVLAISPRLLDAASDFLGIYYPPATLFLLAIVLLLAVCLHYSWELSRLEERTRTLAQEAALISAVVQELTNAQGAPIPEDLS